MRTEIFIILFALAWFVFLAFVDLTTGLVGPGGGITQGVLCIALVMGLSENPHD